MLRLERMSASTSDVARLQALLEQAPRYSQIAAGGPVPADAAAQMLSALPPDKEAHDKFVLGAIENSSLIGCADLIRGYPSPSIAFIGLLLVGEPWEKLGYGSVFLSELCKLVADWNCCHRLRLGVLATNGRALEFWARLGFIATGEVKPYVAGRVRTEVLLFERALFWAPPGPAVAPDLRPFGAAVSPARGTRHGTRQDQGNRFER